MAVLDPACGGLFGHVAAGGVLGEDEEGMSLDGIRDGRPQVNREGQGTLGIGNGSEVHRIDDNNHDALRLKQSSRRNQRLESKVCTVWASSRACNSGSKSTVFKVCDVSQHHVHTCIAARCST